MSILLSKQYQLITLVGGERSDHPTIGKDHKSLDYIVQAYKIIHIDLKRFEKIGHQSF